MDGQLDGKFLRNIIALCGFFALVLTAYATIVPRGQSLQERIESIERWAAAHEVWAKTQSISRDREFAQLEKHLDEKIQSVLDEFRHQRRTAYFSPPLHLGPPRTAHYLRVGCPDFGM